MVIETQISVGDVIELSPSKMSTLDDLDLEKCTVLEVDYLGKRIRVVFNNNNLHSESSFDKSSTIDWFSTEHVIDIERDYQIIGITDNQDTVSNQQTTILTMAKVIKTVSQTKAGYNLAAQVNENETELFIYTGIAYDDLAGYMGKIKRVAFSKYRAEDVVINGGAAVRAWHANNKIVDIDDVFVAI